MIIVTANQILAHLLGDYIFQSDWMARDKRKEIGVCLLHAWCYTIPFWFLIDDMNMRAWFYIWFPHLLIDYFGVAAFVIRLRNTLGDGMHSFKKGATSKLGFYHGTPDFVQFFVFVAVDNTLHILTNAMAISYFVYWTA